METKTILVHFPIPLYALLKQEGKERAITVSSIIREGVAEWFEKRTGNRPEHEVDPVGRP